MSDKIDNAPKQTDATAKEAAENMRQCLSYSIYHEYQFDGKEWGPWTVENAMQNGQRSGNRQTDESAYKNIGRVLRTEHVSNDGKSYFIPDGGKVVYEDKAIDADGHMRKLEPGSEEYKNVMAAQKALHYSKLPFCETQEHVVQEGDKLWNLVKDNVVKNDKVSDTTIANVVNKTAKENHLADPDLILDGTKLILPAPFKVEK